MLHGCIGKDLFLEGIHAHAKVKNEHHRETCKLGDFQQKKQKKSQERVASHAQKESNDNSDEEEDELEKVEGEYSGSASYAWHLGL